MRYEFTVTLSGEGDSPEEAWDNAVNSLCEDPGEPETTKLVDDNEQ